MAILRFHIVPNAKTDKVIGEHESSIKVKLRAPAVEGKANAALRCFLAEKLNVAQHAIVLERGLNIAQQIDSHQRSERRRCALLSA